jgi:hypothetical protein
VSSAIATVNVVAAHNRASELLGKKIQFVRRLGATKHAEAWASVPLRCTLKAGGGAVESLLPTGGSKLPIFPNQGMGESLSSGICHISLPADGSPYVAIS